MTNVKVIHELYRCFREKDYESFRRICTDDLVWIQNEGFPNGATHIGPEAVIEGVFKSNLSEWEGFTYRMDELLDAGSSVIVIGQYEAHHYITKKQMRAVAAHVYDLREGKVSRFRMFADTKPMWDAMS